MANLKDFVSGLGLALTGLLLSSFIHSQLPALHTFKSEIFATNCRLLISNQLIDGTLPMLPDICSTIEFLIPASLIANGLTLMLMGANKLMSLITIINLAVLASFYCNPLIDSSFRSYAHFLQVMVCAGAFLVKFLKEENIEQGKSHQE